MCVNASVWHQTYKTHLVNFLQIQINKNIVQLSTCIHCGQWTLGSIKTESRDKQKQAGRSQILETNILTVLFLWFSFEKKGNV